MAVKRPDGLAFRPYDRANIFCDDESRSFMSIFKTAGMSLGFVLSAFPANAEVVNASPDGFELKLERHSERLPKPQFDRILRISEWWSGEHTYSGDASNLRITTLAAGGQWRETWAAGDVEHGRVLSGSRADGIWMVRFEAALGPLQGMGVNGVLTIEVKPSGDTGSNVSFSYMVTGADFQELDQIAPVVDGVLEEQIDNLVSAGASPPKIGPAPLPTQ